MVTSDGARWDVVGVKRRSDGVVEHTITTPQGGQGEGKEGTTNDQSSPPVGEGDAVTVHVDWARRFDHMQLHSGQHLVSAVCRALFNANTKSWWLSSYPQQCYIDLDHPPFTSGQLEQLSAGVNQLIFQQVPMKVHTFDSVKAALEDEKFVAQLHKKPDPGFVGQYRAVEIDGVEMNTCCGTHLQNVGQLQCFIATRVERLTAPKQEKKTTPTKDDESMTNGKGGETQKPSCWSRLYFLTGNRALKYAAETIARQESVRKVIGAAEPQMVERAHALVDTQRRLQRQVKFLQQETAMHKAVALASQNGVGFGADGNRSGSGDGDDEKPLPETQTRSFDLLHTHISPDAGGLPFCLALGNAYLEQLRLPPVKKKGKKGKKQNEQAPAVDEKNSDSTVYHSPALLVTSGEEGEEGVFTLVGPSCVVDAIGRPLVKAMGGRGGGRGRTMQGVLPKLSLKTVSAAVLETRPTAQGVGS